MQENLIKLPRLSLWAAAGYLGRSDQPFFHRFAIPTAGARTVRKERDMLDVLRVLNGALDTEGEFTVLRGRIDPATLDALQVDDYQREILPASTIEEIVAGFRKNDGSVPDLDLGMRGARYDESGGTFVLHDPVFVIDGLQRVTAAKRYRDEGGTPVLGATVHFNTSYAWELDRFSTLNADRTKLSPNVLLRNTRGKYAAVDLLYAMSMSDPQLAMRDRVCWQQRKQRAHLITAVTFVRTINLLHLYLRPGIGGTTVDEVARGSQRLLDQIGRNTLRDNVRAFFQLVEDCWGIKTVTYSDTAPHIRYTFLHTLARVLDNHERFWREKKLFVEIDLVRKLKAFKIYDPTVQQLSGSSGQAANYLYSLIVEHLNKGRRAKLIERRATDQAGPSDEPPAAREAEAG